jgi:signal transduction histidine kinase
MNTPSRPPKFRNSLHSPHWLLAGHLLLLHALAFGGWQIPAVRILWLGALGLFLLWQPFIAGERQISLRQTLMLAAIAVLSTILLGPWLLLIWCGALAAVIGGRVLWTGPRLERAGYLLAFGYLVCLTIFGVVPEISPVVTLAPLPRESIALLLPALLLLLLLFPAHTMKRRVGDAFDLFYGLTVFLTLAVFVLGSLAYMQVGAVSYVESLFRTSLTMAGALLLLAWAWNPRAGVYGISSLLTRYLLTLGLPLEQWLIMLSEISEREPHPTRFLEQIMQQLERLPWITGVRCQAFGESVAYGETTLHEQSLRRGQLSLSVFFRTPAAPAMQWHVDWLLRLAAEFFLVKYQAHQLHQMSYLQAVYETGARVTHDVKNLLQSLQTLCYAAEQPGSADAKAELFARQLPKIAERLQATLEKLQRPQLDSAELAPAQPWWQALQERYALAEINWLAPGEEAPEVLTGLFDSVADNLIQNALNKRQREPDLKITVILGVDRNKPRLSVCDDGSLIPLDRVSSLLRVPIASEDGLGIGLYHAAHQAEASGYSLLLTENCPGKVCFSLASNSA